MQTYASNPILNSPYEYPDRYWEIDSTGIPTGTPREGRRPNRYVIPVPASRRRSQQAALDLDTEETSDNTLVTSIRPQVDQWRRLPPSKWKVTPETERLLRWWRDGTVREYPFFFCQLEAVETIIWLAEVAPRSFRDSLIEANESANPELFRIAAKMATGSGKTMVMAMLIAWQAVNAARRPKSTRYTNGFLIVTPGITIRDRLRVLKPEEPENYFDDPLRRIIPPEMKHDLGKARVVVTNFHAMQHREKISLSPTSRKILGDRGEEKRFTETEGEMIARVAKALMGVKRVVVINDEAHHCYREKPGDSEEGKLDAEAKAEATENAKAARIWISGIEALTR